MRPGLYFGPRLAAVVTEAMRQVPYSPAIGPPRKLVSDLTVGQLDFPEVEAAEAEANAADEYSGHGMPGHEHHEHEDGGHAAVEVESEWYPKVDDDVDDDQSNRHLHYHERQHGDSGDFGIPGDPAHSRLRRSTTLPAG